MNSTLEQAFKDNPTKRWTLVELATLVRLKPIDLTNEILTAAGKGEITRNEEVDANGKRSSSYNWNGA